MYLNFSSAFLSVLSFSVFQLSAFQFFKKSYLLASIFLGTP